VPRRKATALILLALAAFAAAIALSIRVIPPRGDPDTLAIGIERARRRAIDLTGGTLPGTPDVTALAQRLKDHGVELGAPVFIRIFKLEFELELWLERDGRFHRFATYPICRYSGALGPKLREGDRQSPEGFYTVDLAALNPQSRWHRSFNLGFPNAVDRAHGRTGSFLMVHGGCSSVGCYAMTDPVIDEIWRLVSAALKRGQPRFHVHVFPFRMTAANLEQRANHPSIGLWQDLAAGHDAFEASQLVPRVRTCNGRYRIELGAERLRGGEAIREVCNAALSQHRTR
jgi:murein L,D-transpeptidase YafK